jgi:hypothetical protein
MASYTSPPSTYTPPLARSTVDLYPAFGTSVYALVCYTAETFCPTDVENGSRPSLGATLTLFARHHVHLLLNSHGVRPLYGLRSGEVSHQVEEDHVHANRG